MAINLMSGIESYDPAQTPGLSGITESPSASSASLTGGNFLQSFMPSSSEESSLVSSSIESLLPSNAQESQGMERAVQASPERQGSQELNPVNYPAVGKLDLLLAIVGGPQSVQLLAQRRNQNIAGPVIVDFTPKFDAAIRSGDLKGANALLQQLAIISPNNPILFDLYKRSADIMVKVQDKAFSNQAGINVLKDFDDGSDPARTKVLAAMQANVTNMTESQFNTLSNKMFPNRELQAGIARQISQLTAKQIGTEQVQSAVSEADKYSTEKKNAIQTELGIAPEQYAEYENKSARKLLSPEAEAMHRANVQRVNRQAEINIGFTQLSAKDRTEAGDAADPDTVSDLLKGKRANKGTTSTQGPMSLEDAITSMESKSTTRDDFVSVDGAVGKGQIKLGTARTVIPDITLEELKDGEVNLAIKKALIARYAKAYPNRADLASVAYFGGPNAVEYDKATGKGRILNPELTDSLGTSRQAYADKVVAKMKGSRATSKPIETSDGTPLSATKPTTPAGKLAAGKTEVEATRDAAKRRAGNIADWQSKDVGEIGGQYGANIDAQGNMQIVRGEDNGPVTGQQIAKMKGARITPASPVGHIITTHSEVREPINIAIKAMLKLSKEAPELSTEFNDLVRKSMANGFTILGLNIAIPSALSSTSPAYQDAVAKANIALTILSKSLKSDNYGLSTGVINGSFATSQSAVTALRAIERGLDGATRGALRQLGAEVPPRESQAEEDARLPKEERPVAVKPTDPLDPMGGFTRRKK